MGSSESIVWSLYALKMSAEVITAVLHTALLGFFIDFTTSDITLSLHNRETLTMQLFQENYCKWLYANAKIYIGIWNMIFALYYLPIINKFKTYSLSCNNSLWNRDNRRTLLSAPHTTTQSFDSRPPKRTWKRNKETTNIRSTMVG